ncbi:MAG TPA: hypothetical protein EYP53_10495, partial [Candidatus Latescibacteria bacterium]|nr:hypothetical protein [Candidatus Latescibacterota bacterium]
MRSLWERYAIPAMGLGHRGEGGPAVAQQRRKTKRERPSLREALESFCREACRTMAATEWREFTLAGESCGGIIPGELSAQARLYPDGIWFQAWNNNLRTAYGLDHFGAKWKEPRLRGMSERIRNLFLAAPEESGLSPVVYSPSMKAWIGSIKYHGG